VRTVRAADSCDIANSCDIADSCDIANSCDIASTHVHNETAEVDTAVIVSRDRYLRNTVRPMLSFTPSTRTSST
jgi:UDP-3-O-[3-hydroxymyristoyl] glucosamine N-acyltransferase